MRLLLGLLLGVGVSWGLWRKTRAVPPPDVSASWLAHQERLERQAGIDAVSWRWPVRKITNEAGQFNAQRLRKRA